MMKLEETEEEAIKKGKRIANITFIIIGIVVSLIIISIFLIKNILESKWLLL